MTMTTEEAKSLAAEWVRAWNAHDLEAILSHYAEEVTLASPLVAGAFGEPSGIIQGKQRLREYFAAGLQLFPDLRFELLGIYGGTGSLAFHYQAVEGKQALEVMKLDAAGKITEVNVCYGMG